MGRELWKWRAEQEIPPQAVCFAERAENRGRWRGDEGHSGSAGTRCPRLYSDVKMLVLNCGHSLGARERIWSDLRFRKTSLTTVRKMDGRDWGLLQVRDRAGVGHEALAPSMGGWRAVVPSAQPRLWRRKERVQCQCGDPVGCHRVWGDGRRGKWLSTGSLESNR